MEEIYKKYIIDNSKNYEILEIGGRRIQKNSEIYRTIFRKHNYIVTDIEPGDNVDIVQKELYKFYDKQVDVIVSGQVIEHVEDIYQWFIEVGKLLKPNGLIFLISPVIHKYHPYPIDCWRIMPDGMKFLFKLANIEPIEIYIAGDHIKKIKSGRDLVSIGQKKTLC